MPRDRDRLPDLYVGDKFPGKCIAALGGVAEDSADRAANVAPSVPVTGQNRRIRTVSDGKLAER
ncbi:hypothetical protein TL10_19675 [Mycolicibacterium llatzerense]|uniref:Uncharacterized protein n=1 Tax=Mycolicibacterium llatzerense TaxID=280871 RepID=A0A0D1L2T2_9MYCO|nr:hypothetical protein TL10_19675 [Mycolicibacterium llatzerense]